jgi:hypothetical protein
MVDHPGPNLYEPLEDRVSGRLDALAGKRSIPDHVEQSAGKTSYEEPGLIGLRACSMTPSKENLPLHGSDDPILAEIF